MSGRTVDFEASDIAFQIEQLSQYDIDNLPFGVIRLDREGVVQFYSEFEARESGYGKTPFGKNMFEVSRCSGKDDFKARIMAAQEEGGPIDLEFAIPDDNANPIRELRIRVQACSRGGVWLFVQRD